MSRYGHAAVVTEVVPGPIAGYPKEVRIVEATPDQGVRERWLRPDEYPRWRFSRFELDDAQRTSIVAAARTQLGKPYDWPSIAGFVVRFWRKEWRGFDPDHPDRKLFCSELVAWVYRDFAGLDLFPGIAPGSVSPGDLADRAYDWDRA
jgi:uncharacterized protein YycO